MNEIVVNLHMHTRYSDGSGSHRDLALAALRHGIDAIVVTDHNIRVEGLEGYFEQGGRRVLVLLGEEVHDRLRLPQKNHLLVFGADRELAPLAGAGESLLEAVRAAGGLAFLAHPVDPPAPNFHEPDISWQELPSGPFAGLELWNGFSELKAHIPSRMHGVFYAFFPALMAHSPLPQAMQLWDRLLEHRPCVAIGGSDAHAIPMRLGPLRRTIFPYDYHFRAVNTHVLLDQPLSADASADGAAILRALAAGQCFIGYDLPASTRGFRFVAHGRGPQVAMGGHIAAKGGVTLHASAPGVCELRLFKDGLPITVVSRGHALTERVFEPGVYRIEARRRYWGRRRTWVVSNPIYVQ